VGPDAAEPVTCAEALHAVRVAFAEAGVENPALDARVVLCEAASLTREDLICEPERALGHGARARLSAMAARRIAREPVSRILGRREFWGLQLAVSPTVLDPRAETEILVEAALTTFAGKRKAPLRILDLGAGSGAILCALLSELPNAWGVALEVSPAAAALGRANLAALGLNKRSQVVVGRWDEPLDGCFDLVVSNPPYVSSGDIAGLAPEVRCYDPLLALDGGPDGLDAYRAIGAALAHLIDTEDGVFFLEVGAGQAEAVTSILAAAGLTSWISARDLAGHDRVVQGCSLSAGRLAHSEEGPWRNAKKRLVIGSESPSPRSPSESRAAAGLASACKAPAPSNA
jgi:release factor glutamine methyltransferase